MGALLIIVRPFIPYIVMIVAAGGSILGWGVYKYNEGYTAAINEIAAENKEAIDAAAKARELHRSCVNTGRVWDTSTGKCSGG